MTLLHTARTSAPALAPLRRLRRPGRGALLKFSGFTDHMNFVEARSNPEF